MQMVAKAGGQLSIRRSGKIEARRVKHPPPLHNACRAFPTSQASVRHLKHPPPLNKARRRHYRLIRLHEGDCAFAQIVKLLQLLQRLLVSSLCRPPAASSSPRGQLPPPDCSLSWRRPAPVHSRRSKQQ